MPELGWPELGFSFGNVVETHHRVWPSYSQTLLNQAQQVLELGAALAPKERESLPSRSRLLLAGRYRLSLRHHLAWRRLSR